MKKSRILARITVGVACLSLPTAALAHDCVKGDSSLDYCKCLYEEALERIKEKQGTSRTSMLQRLEALKSAMERCFKGSSQELETEIQKI